MQFKQSRIYPSEIFNEIINLENIEFKKNLREIYQMDDEINVIYVIEDGQIIAYLSYKELDESLDIYMLMVKTEYRQQNIASMMLEQLMYKNIILEVRIANIKAINFYQKHGFEQIRTLKNYYENGEDGLVMYKEI